MISFFKKHLFFVRPQQKGPDNKNILYKETSSTYGLLPTHFTKPCFETERIIYHWALAKIFVAPAQAPYNLHRQYPCNDTEIDQFVAGGTISAPFCSPPQWLAAARPFKSLEQCIGEN